jgi:hypothetical protein
MDLNGVVNERNDLGTCNGVVISVFFLCTIWREIDLKKLCAVPLSQLDENCKL